MCMAVDEPGHHQLPTGVDHLCIVVDGDADRGTDVGNAPIFDQHSAVSNDVPSVIHGQQGGRLDQQRTHCSALTTARMVIVFRAATSTCPDGTNLLGT